MECLRDECDVGYRAYVRTYRQSYNRGRGTAHDRRVEISLDSNARAPAAAVAQRIPQMEVGDLYRQTRGRGGRARLLAISGLGAEAVAAIPAMAFGDEVVRERR